MKKYMWECYLQYCVTCFCKNEEPTISFKDHAYIFFGKEAYKEEFKESYQGVYS